MKTEGLVRREVLIPGELLPEKQLGKHHGLIAKITSEGERQMVQINLTDFRKLKLQLPIEVVLPHVLPKPERPPRPRFQPTPQPTKRSGAATSAQSPKKKKRPPPAPEGVPLHGTALQAHIRLLSTVAVSDNFPPGTRLWAKTSNHSKWPGIAWSLALCKQRDIGDLVLSHKPGLMLIRFYGQHSMMWIAEDKCELPPPPGDADNSELDLIKQLRAWGRQHNKLNLVKLALDEMAGAHNNPSAEASRVVQLYDAYLQQRMEQDTCWLCRDGGASRLQCGVCDRRFHSLCLRSPCVSEDHCPGGKWECPCCFETQAVEEPPAPPEEGEGAEDEEQVERMGLTPDWLISAAAFQVFKLPRPNADRPFIPGLLDPCTNSKIAPNIPAQVLYDKQDDGLLLSNSWAGKYILLNPDYRAQVQWRFVNRAIDEVENGSVPAIILVVRNSTDTAYFQRLRPYPRIMLRRTTAQFKDYNKSPPGFGICVFCVAQHDKRELFADFVAAFEPFGEPSLVFDLQLLEKEAFFEQLARSKTYAEENHRDHWVQCGQCGKWRIIDFLAASALNDDDEWTCTLLRPPFTSCDTPLSRSELAGGHYAAKNVGEGLDGDNEEGRGQAQWTAVLPSANAPRAALVNVAEVPKSPQNSIPSAKNVSVPEMAVKEAISVLPLKPLQIAITSQRPDAEVVTALELARQARIAANRAYLQHLTSTGESSDSVEASLPCDHPAVLMAAREVARIAAMEACAAQKEAAWTAYEQARRKRQQDEAPLLSALQAVREVEEAAKQKWEAAQRAADDIAKELNNAVAVPT